MRSVAIRRADLVPLAGSPAIYLVGVLAAGFVSTASEDAWLPVLFVFGGSAALFAWRTVRWPDTAARYLSFGAVLLLACVVNRLLYCVDYALAGSHLDEWPFPVARPESAVFKGEVLTVVGTLLTVLAWLAAGGVRVTPLTILRGLAQHRNQLLGIYAMSLVALLVTQRLPTVAAGYGLLLPTLQALGLVTAVLLPLARLKRAAFIVPVVLCLSAPFLLASVGTGMKESIILALLPVGAIMWARVRSAPGRLIIVGAGIVGLALITSYVGYFRDSVWRDRTGTVTMEEAMTGYLDEVKWNGANTAIGNGVTKFLARSNLSVARGWAVAIADEQGLQPELVFGPLVYVFVPRVLWPDKPAIRQGWQYSELVFGPAYTNWSDSSTAAGFYSALYLGSGWFAFVAGALLAGYLVAKATIVAQRLGGDLAAGLYVLTLAPFALRMDEQWTVGVFSAPIITLVYVLAIAHFVRLITLQRL